MSAEAKFEQFWAAHQLSRALAQATLNFFQRTALEVYGPPLPFKELEDFRREVQAAYEATFQPDNIKPPRPSLRIVTGD
jgi:hypothetical protein